MSEEKEESLEEPFVVKRDVISYEYSIIFSEEIVNPAYRYTNLCHMLRNEVKEDDIVNIHLANYGGSCDSAIAIVNAMRDCDGRIKVFIESPSYSAATMIALAGDELELKPYTFMMFHNFSDIVEGKAGELKMEVINNEKLIHTLMQDLYAPFLTKAEINAILNDKDVYIHWNDSGIKDRIKRHESVGEDNG